MGNDGKTYHVHINLYCFLVIIQYCRVMSALAVTCTGLILQFLRKQTYTNMFGKVLLPYRKKLCECYYAFKNEPFN